MSNLAHSTPPALILFDLSVIEDTFRTNNFDQAEVVERLIGLARSPNPKFALPAIKQLTAYTHQAMVAAGQLARTTVKESSNGQRTRSISTVTRVVSLSERRPFAHGRFLPGAEVANALSDLPAPSSLAAVPPDPTDPADGAAARPADRLEARLDLEDGSEDA